MSSAATSNRAGAAQTPMPQVGIRQGYLTKQGNKVKTWKRRWFVLSHDQLCYYEKPTEVDSLGQIPLKSTQSVVEASDSDTSRQNCLKMVTAMRTYYLCADTRKELEEWMHALRSMASLYITRQVVSGTNDNNNMYNEAVRTVCASANNVIICADHITHSLVGFPKLQEDLRTAIGGLGSKSINLAAAAFVAYARQAAARTGIVSAGSMSQLSQAAESVRDCIIKILDLIKVADVPDSDRKRVLITAAFAIRDSTSPLVNYSNNSSSSGGVSASQAAAASSPVKSNISLATSSANNNSFSNNTNNSVNGNTSGNTNNNNNNNNNRSNSSGVATNNNNNNVRSPQQQQQQPSAPSSTVAALDEYIKSRTQTDDDELVDALREAAHLSAMLVESVEQDISEEELVVASKNTAGALRTVMWMSEEIARRVENEIFQTHLYDCIDSLRETALRLLSAAKAASLVPPPNPKNLEAMLSLHSGASAVADALKEIMFSTQSARQLLEATGAIAQISSLEKSLVGYDISPIYRKMIDVAAKMTLTASSISRTVQTPTGDSDDNIRIIMESVRGLAAQSKELTGSAQEMKVAHEASGTSEPENLTAVIDASGNVTQSTIELIAAIKALNSTPASIAGGASPAALAISTATRNLSCAVALLLTAGRVLEFDAGAGHDIEMEVPDTADSNMWDEPNDSPDNIICSTEEDTSGQMRIRAGSLNKLVERLTSENMSDVKYMKTFITTYRSFTTPHKFFSKLRQRYDVPVPRLPAHVPVEEFRKKTTLPIQLRVFNVLKAWVEVSYYDFDDQLNKAFDDFASRTLVMDGHEGPSKQLVNAKQKSVQREAALSRVVPASAVTNTLRTKGPQDIKSAITILMSSEPEDVAKQLTVIDFGIFSAIRQVELLNQAWNKTKLRHRAPHVLEMINRFNCLSQFVASCIVHEEKIVDRIKLYSKFVDIATHLRRLNNFNSLLAIIAGFGNAAVHRLKHTKNTLQKSQINSVEQYEHLMSSEKSYQNFRECLHNVNPPCIPYLGMYLTDLTFIEDGNPDYLKTTSDNARYLINFRKRELIYNVIMEVQQYQQVPYPAITKNDKISNLLLNDLPADLDKNLYELSLKREPRGVEFIELS